MGWCVLDVLSFPNLPDSEEHDVKLRSPDCMSVCLRSALDLISTTLVRRQDTLMNVTEALLEAITST